MNKADDFYFAMGWVTVKVLNLISMNFIIYLSLQEQALDTFVQIKLFELFIYTFMYLSNYHSNHV
jgi:hypothetical protein